MIVNTLNEIEQAVRQLSSEEFAAFRVWFAEFNDLESQGIDKEQAHIRPPARILRPHPSPLPKERGQEVLAPFSLGRRVGEGLPHCVRRAI